MLESVILSQEQATSALGRYRLSLINDVLERSMDVEECLPYERGHSESERASLATVVAGNLHFSSFFHLSLCTGCDF